MREAFIAELMEWVGTPYQYQQSVKGLACDCIGLVIGALRELGKLDSINRQDLLMARAYKRNITSKPLTDAMERNADRIPTATAKAGDILMMKFGDRNQHVAVLVEDNRIIHITERTKKVVIEKYSAGWRKRVVAAYRVREA